MAQTDRSHGSPYDRGAADSYYRRRCIPHYHIFLYQKSCDDNDGYVSETIRVSEDTMTATQISEYYAGYHDNEMAGDYKEYD
jgi:hypothetical protein